MRTLAGTPPCHVSSSRSHGPRQPTQTAISIGPKKSELVLGEDSPGGNTFLLLFVCFNEKKTQMHCGKKSNSLYILIFIYRCKVLLKCK